MSKWEMNVDKGLTFLDNQMTTKWIDTPYVTKTTDGLLLSSLQGDDEQTIGCDNHTLINSSNGVAINPDVVQCIYSMCAWKVTSRTTGSYTVDETIMKTTADIISECNSVVDTYGYMPYNLRLNDLFMFRYSAIPVQYPGWSISIDDCERYASTPCLALFVVTAVTRQPNSLKLATLTLKCVWKSSDNPIINTLTVGDNLT